MTLKNSMPVLPAEPTCADLRAEIDAHLLALPEVDQMLASIHRTLARHPERHTSVQPLLANLLKHRTQIAHRLGLAMASWVRAGGQLALHSPDPPAASPADDPLPAPASLPTEPRPLAEPPEASSASLPASPTGATAQRSSSSINAAPPSQAPEPDVSAARDAPPPAPQITPAPTPQTKVLTELLALVGPPRYLNTVFEVLDEVEGLEALTRPPAMNRWPLLPKPVRGLLAMAVARTRAVKDKGSLLSPGVRDRLKIVIATFPAYTKRHAPGYVNGLQLGHNPEGPSWRADGVTFWEQLQRFSAHAP